MLQKAFIFRLRHANGHEVSAIGTQRAIRPDHGWDGRTFTWNSHGTQVMAAVRGEPSEFEVLDAVPTATA